MSSTTCTPITRRRFLAATSTMATAPLILSAVRLIGRDAPNNRVNLAVIGCGARSRGAMLSGEPWSGVRFVAAVDPFHDRSQSMAASLNEKYETNACQAFSDFREIIGRMDIDGVAVFTPDHWHVPIALAAARNRKDMYVEKPLGVAMTWAWQLRGEIERNGVIFQYGTQQRSGSQFRRACELVRNGYIGNIQRVDVWCPALSESQHVARREEPVPAGFDYDLWTGPSPMRPYQPERVSNEGAWHCHDSAIGFIAGWGAHPIDICQWGLGMDHGGPAVYEGTGSYSTDPAELYDTTRRWDIHCKYVNGIRMHFMDETTARRVVTAYHPVFRDHGTAFIGDDGWISVDRSAMYTSDNARLRKLELKPTDERLPQSHDHFGNFVDCMRSRATPVSPFEAAIRSDTISHLAEIVVRTGRSLEWDPESERIKGAQADQTALLDRPVRREYRF